jgi:endonuclease-3
MIPPRSGASPVPFILDFLAREYPSARVVLHYRNEYQLLVATVLAAQCIDDRVNQVTPALFARYPGPEEILSASQEEIEEGIRPTGFYRNKARALKGVADALVARHGGRVPKSMEELTALPGVGRKTAAILLGACFGVDALPVDTHVGRVSFRLGLSRSKDPIRIEEDLSKMVPNGRRWEFATRLGWHGRRICVSRRPICSVCGASPACPRFGVTRHA